MPNPSFSKNSNDTIKPIAGRIREVHTFSKCICLKVNIIAWLEFELAYFEAAVQHFNHCTMWTPPCDIKYTYSMQIICIQLYDLK